MPPRHRAAPSASCTASPTAALEAGYGLVAASGSQGTITMMVIIDANGAITGISVVSHSETSGIGTRWSRQ